MRIHSLWGNLGISGLSEVEMDFFTVLSSLKDTFLVGRNQWG